MKHQAILFSLLCALAAPMLAACDGMFVVVNMAPSPGIMASISVAGAGAYGVNPYSCAPSPGIVVASPSFDLILTPSNTMDVSRVTLQLLDGSHVGGPSVTFPQPVLASQFGSTRILAGDTRTFRMEPGFGCSPQTIVWISADVVLIDLGGATHRTHVTAPVR